MLKSSTAFDMSIEHNNPPTRNMTFLMQPALKDMSLNLVTLDGAEFSVDAYTEAVEAEFAAEFSINNYTAAAEAEFLQTFFDDDEDTDDSIDD
jgi:hypothetical protein